MSLYAILYKYFKGGLLKENLIRTGGIKTVFNPYNWAKRSRVIISSSVN